MKLIKIDDNQRIQYDKFVSENETGSFLQSYEWGEFRISLNNKIFRLVVTTDDGQFLASAFFYKQPMQLGQSILICSKGPLLKDGLSHEDKLEALELIFSEVDKLMKREKILGVQIEPNTNDQEWLKYFNEFNFEKTENDLQPRHTLIVDIRQQETEILEQMHSKTRYNIRLAEKKGVEIEVDNSKFKEFWELLKKTEERQNISMFSEHYFKNLLKVPFVKLYLAEYQGEIIGANIMIFWNNTATYLFGASDYEYRQIMAPYLLQWQAIKSAKDEKCWFYDFWGAAPKDAIGREGNWGGFTRFKMGFSPNAELTEYLGTYEKLNYPIRTGLYRFIQKKFKK